MKRSGLLIFAALLTVGCSKSDSEGSGSGVSRVTFRASDAVTRTVCSDDLTVSWDTGDKVLLWADAAQTQVLDAAEFCVDAIDGGVATFGADLSQMPRGTYRYCSAYPVPTSRDGRQLSYELPSTVDGVYDCSKDVLVAEPTEAIALTQKGCSLSLSYRHALHGLRIVVPGGKNSYAENVTSVSVTFPGDVVGRVVVDACAVAATTVSGGSTVTIENTDSEVFAAGAWAFIAPADFSGGEIKVSVSSAKHTSDFTVSAKNFVAGHYTRMIVNMPEVLLLDDVMTLLDNNDGTVADPESLTLTATLAGTDFSNVTKSGIEYTLAGGTPVKAYASGAMTSQRLSVTVSGLASGVYEVRGFVEKSDGTTVYTDTKSDMRVVGAVSLSLGEVYTSFDKYVAGNIEAANALDGGAVYTSDNTVNIASAYVSEISAAGVMIDGAKTAAKTVSTSFNCGAVGSQSYGEHALRGYVTIGGVDIVSQPCVISVTGIPYSCDFTGHDKAFVESEGWAFSSYSFKNTGVATKLTMNKNCYGAKRFYAPSLLTLTYDFGVGSYGFSGSTTYTIGLAASAGAPTTATSSYSDGRNVYTHVVSHSKSASVDMTSENCYLSVSTNSDNSYIYTVKVKYR